MNVMEKVLQVLGSEEDGKKSPLWQFLGPLFLLCIAFLAPGDPLIFGVSCIGLLLSARFQIRGFVYGVVLLGIGAVGEHTFLTSDHWWQFGLETASGIAFFITALSSQQRSSTIESLSGVIDARSLAISHLEEELARVREEKTSIQMGLEQKIEALELRLEEVSSEEATLVILNDVLRKTTALHLSEKNGMKEALFDAEKRMESLQESLSEAQRDRDALMHTHPWALQNQSLLEELNQARFDREQIRLIGETIAKEHAKEVARAKDATQRLQQIQEEHQKLHSGHLLLKQEAQILNGHLETIHQEREKYRAALQRVEEMQKERSFLKERLESAEFALSQKKEIAVSSDEVNDLKQRVGALQRVELLYQQLKAQFEEKDRTLHQTRAELFRTDTELQVLKIANEQQEFRPTLLSEEALKEMAAFEEEIDRLEQENEDLEGLITLLNDSSFEDASRRKKKLKMDPDQTLLF